MLHSRDAVFPEGTQPPEFLAGSMTQLRSVLFPAVVRTTGPSQYLLIGAKVTSEDLAPDLSILFLVLLA